MTRSAHTTLLLPLVLSLALLAAPGLLAAPAADVSVLGSGGVLFNLQAGTYASLVPDGNQTHADNVVLTLVVEDSEGLRTAHVVPGTEGSEVESNPSLVLEPLTETLYLLWESWRGVANSDLRLISYSADGWSDIIEVNSSPYVFKHSPRLAVTRDEFSTQDGAGDTVVHQRTTVHLAWIEDPGTGEQQVVYSPQFVVDGKYVHGTSLVVLDDLIGGLGSEEPGPEAASISQSLTLRKGDAPNTVVIAVVDADTRQAVSFDVAVVPGELSLLAESLHEVVLNTPDVPAQAGQDALDRIADRSRSHLIDFGHNLRYEFLREVADSTATFIAQADAGSSLQSIADRSRSHLIDFGARLDRSGIRNVRGPSRSHLIDFGYRGEMPPEAKDVRDTVHNHVRLSPLNVRPLPELRPEGAVSVLVSSSGQEMILVQEGDADQLLYRESLPDGWGAENRLRLSEDFDREAARDLLERRLDLR